MSIHLNNIDLGGFTTVQNALESLVPDPNLLKLGNSPVYVHPIVGAG
jgi:hypothetical protein